MFGRLFGALHDLGYSSDFDGCGVWGREGGQMVDPNGGINNIRDVLEL